MVSAWFQLRQIGTVELRFRPKLDHVETETSRNWINSVSCSDLQSDDVIFQKQWAGLTAFVALANLRYINALNNNNRVSHHKFTGPLPHNWRTGNIFFSLLPVLLSL